MNRVRARHGLPPLRPDLGALYTDADVILYADPPIGETSHPPSPKERYIGPLLWSPPVATPVWWTADAPSSVPTVYVTMGSSGPPEALASILDTLAGFPVSVIASTAGAAIPRQLPHNARVAPYLPGVEASRRACLVICNGGSPTCHQALAQGVPVVGISTNMDQFLNMQELERLECGIALRSDRCTPSILRRAFTQALASETLRAGARRWQEASCGVSLEEELSLLVG
jgi:UDP:flavonoid glycosyltransferase YjiC (YdhE family)